MARKFRVWPLGLAALIAMMAASSAQMPNTGIQVKRPVFGGACKLCPWGALGEVVKQAMQPYGYDVQLCYNCNRADAPRIVAGAKLPPYEKDPAVSVAMAPPNAPGLGPVDFGATGFTMSGKRTVSLCIPERLATTRKRAT